MPKKTEACGRCSMSVVVDAAENEEGDATARDPFAGDRIEIGQREFDRVSPGAWLNRVSARIDSAVTRFVWGR